VKAELVSTSKALQQLTLLLNEVVMWFASSGLNFDIHLLLNALRLQAVVNISSVASFGILKSRFVGWCLMAASAQRSYLAPL